MKPISFRSKYKIVKCYCRNSDLKPNKYKDMFSLKMGLYELLITIIIKH